MQRFIYILILLFTIHGLAIAQIDEEPIDDEKIEDNTVISNEKLKERKKFKPDNIFLGSNFSLQIGNAVFVDISPYGGYKFGKMIRTGIGGTYIYTSFLSTNTDQHIYGGRLFVDFRPFPNVKVLPILKGVYLHAEAEFLNRESGVITRGNIQREWVPAVNVGLGFNSNFNKGFAFTAELLVNALWFSRRNGSLSNIYNSPFQYRVGICYTFANTATE